MLPTGKLSCQRLPNNMACVGVVALLGGGEFDATGANEDIDRQLLARADATEVLVLPTADAFEHPQVAVEHAVEWFARLGASATGLYVLTRPDALDEENAAAVAAARLMSTHRPFRFSISTCAE